MSLPNDPRRRKRLRTNDNDRSSGNSASELPDVTDLTNAEAAQMYAKAGLHIVPIKPGTKNPGSYLGQGWPARATDDLESVREWWERWPDAGIASHVGGCGLIVIDVDVPENVPDWLWVLLESAVFRRTTTDSDSKRGHYFYRLRPGEVFGCGLGRLKPPKGERWGEVKCYGGAVVLGPTQHPRDGGHYATAPGGALSFLPAEIAQGLNAPDVNRDEPVDAGELAARVKAFLGTHTDNDSPHALEPICKSFDPTPTNRHSSMWDALCWAMREAKAGRFSATDAVDALRARWTDAIGGQYRGGDPDEFDRMLRDAVAAADAAGTREELAARAHGFTDAETCRAALDGIDSWAPAVADAWNDASDGSPSWAPVDVRAARDSRSVLLPTILARADGPCLFYRGRIHSVHGETESGKSWLVQCATAECLLIGEPVLYLDFEDEAGAVAERLVRLGVPADAVENPALFVYVHPETPPTTERERQAFDALLNGTYSLAVVDGVTDSMALFGLSGMDADDVARWHRELPKAVAHRTGAAVVCVDHVAKDSQTRGRFALGSHHKIAGLSGAAYVVEMLQPFAVGQAGRASVRVGKDRPGRVRGLGSRWRKSDRTQHVADLLLDSTDAERTVWALDRPSHGGASTDTDDGKPSKTAFRPTWFMEQVSRYWEETDDPAKRTNTKTVDAMCAERKEQGKTQHRQRWRDAIKVLEAEEFAITKEGARDSIVYTVTKPYRQLNDPLCDEYAEAAVKDVDNWKVQIEAEQEGGEK